MSKLRVTYRWDPAMKVHRSSLWTKRMVYVLIANRAIKYLNGRSRVIYIGTTKRGERRPASSAASKSIQAFAELRGVKWTEVHLLSSERRPNTETWRLLESALLIVFRSLYGKLPYFNKRLDDFRKLEQVDDYFRSKNLIKILRGFER